jgi:TNF receptor-associated protein 1
LLFNLSLYDSSVKNNITLDEYLTIMKKDQKKIYYFLAPSKELALQSPFMDSFIYHEIPVLFLSINVEEMTFQEI